MNHLEKQHPKLQHLRKRTNTRKEDKDATEKATDAAQATNNHNFKDELRHLFLHLPDLTLQVYAKSPEEQRE